MVTFNDSRIEETRDLSEDILMEFDGAGNPVSMTIEHASLKANMPDFSFNQVGRELVHA